MITFSKFGNQGRLGNQLFQYAAMIGFEDKYDRPLALPYWDFSKYFEGEYPYNPHITGFALEEPVFHYMPEVYDVPLNNKEADWDMVGYFQTEKYWVHCKTKVKKALKFKDEFIKQVKNRFADNCPFDEKTIAITIRRGDYVDNENYHLLPITYFINALYHHFPDWKDYNIVIFSDDIPYCKTHFDCVDNVFFSENNSPIEDICLMSLCDNFILSNSSFSWWGAYIGQKEHSKVIRPIQHFEGKLKKKCNIKDYYPEDWIPFDYTQHHVDLSDVTFTIPVMFDHPDRQANLGLSVCLLQKHFRTNIIVMETGAPSDKHFEYCSSFATYIHRVLPVFHRTKMLNEMALIAKTPIIVNWDADIIIAPFQLLQTVEKIREGYDIVYPYDGRFARIPRLQYFKQIEKRLDIGIVGDTKFNGMNNSDAKSFGGAVAFNKESFIKGGMENEYFISFGPEDEERALRFTKLDFKFGRVNGALYHINHWIGDNSSKRNKFFEANHKEYDKVQGMSKKELINYIKTWQWL